MARPLPFAFATLLSVLTLGSLATAEEPKKEDAKKEDAKKEEPREEPAPSTPSDTTSSSKAEHPTDTPKATSGEENKYDWRKEPGGEHGSQVASSEWLPIAIGAGAGVLVGTLAGAAFDDSKPPVVGPIVGGIAGGFAGGAGGAWLIRTQREKDTRFAGTITGLSIGVATGALIFAKVEADGRALETVGKYGALVIAPLLGAVAGHAIASHFYLRPAREVPAAPVAILPSVSPVITGSHGATGMTFGLDAVF